MQRTLTLARRLLNWRKTSLAIQRGTFRHFTIKMVCTSTRVPIKATQSQ